MKHNVFCSDLQTGFDDWWSSCFKWSFYIILQVRCMSQEAEAYFGEDKLTVFLHHADDSLSEEICLASNGDLQTSRWARVNLHIHPMSHFFLLRQCDGVGAFWDTSFYLFIFLEEKFRTVSGTCRKRKNKKKQVEQTLLEGKRRWLALISLRIGK